MASLSNSTTGIGDAVSNGLEVVVFVTHMIEANVDLSIQTYVILQQIGRGKDAVVYRAICKSGRLRGRQLVLRKVRTLKMVPVDDVVYVLQIPSTSAQPHCSPPSISLALHHPNIVSMFSAFSTPLETFHVLELCSVGNLSDFLRSRDPPILLEAELRGIAKCLIDALVYLKKELVVHCNITPSKILLTSDYCVVRQL